MCRKLIYVIVLAVLGWSGTLAGGELIKINFQLAGAPVPEGYLPDTGLLFGDQGNGYSYGWSQDMTGQTRDRNNAAAPDQRYDTLIHFMGTGAIWEIELLPDTYRVFIVCGDPSYADSNNQIELEGEVLADDPDGADNYDEFEFIIPVTDGRLTWSEPASAYVKPCFIEIESSQPVVKATKPNPPNGSMHFDTWVVMSWQAGQTAVSHDVYLGDDLDAVSNGDNTSEVFQGNQVATDFMAGFPGFAYPNGLVPGTTYYWRIDEVEADGTTIHKGDVWSFFLPPKTAYNPDPVDGAEFVDETNVTLRWTPGYGAKLHTVYLGDDYDTVNNAVGGMMLGNTSYKPGPLQKEMVYYWRVDEFDAVQTYKGDIWCFTTSGAVGNAKPANNATGVAMTGTLLSWTPSDSAASHEIYFGLDKEAVRTADDSSPEFKGNKALGSESYDPGKLIWQTPYYWRVDEVDSLGKTTKGPVWTFVTADFITVDDFESYTDNDAAGEAVWQSWIDGFGIADNGAQAGYLVPPYCEQTIVHGGAQSLPLIYTNEAGVTNSEATLTLSYPRDWTEEGVGVLSLWFNGRFQNASEPLYLTVSNNTGTPVTLAHEDPEAAKKSGWNQWMIPLSAFTDKSIDLTNVNKIAIGLGSNGGVSAGGTGTILIDDIALYRP